MTQFMEHRFYPGFIIITVEDQANKTLLRENAFIQGGKKALEIQLPNHRSIVRVADQYHFLDSRIRRIPATAGEQKIAARSDDRFPESQGVPNDICSSDIRVTSGEIRPRFHHQVGRVVEDDFGIMKLPADS
ncbi:MAG: hypothetical protein ACKN9W_13715 [Methylococcus sp.]